MQNLGSAQTFCPKSDSSLSFPAVSLEQSSFYQSLVTGWAGSTLAQTHPWLHFDPSHQESAASILFLSLCLDCVQGWVYVRAPLLQTFLSVLSGTCMILVYHCDSWPATGHLPTPHGFLKIALSYAHYQSLSFINLSRVSNFQPSPDPGLYESTSPKNLHTPILL